MTRSLRRTDPCLNSIDVRLGVSWIGDQLKAAWHLTTMAARAPMNAVDHVGEIGLTAGALGFSSLTGTRCSTRSMLGAPIGPRMT